MVVILDHQKGNLLDQWVSQMKEVVPDVVKMTLDTDSVKLLFGNMEICLQEQIALLEDSFNRLHGEGEFRFGIEWKPYGYTYHITYIKSRIK